MILEGAGDVIRLSVKDSGIGFTAGTPGAEGGIGLLSMKARVALVGGNFEIHSHPGQGTEVRVALPLGVALTRRSRILLADDHGLILAGARSLLEAHYDVVGQLGDGRSLVAAALRLRPDLVILDISMPAMNGIDAAREIRKGWPEVKLLFLSMHSSPVYLREAMDAGGAGYVIKSAANEELRIAVERILNGQMYISAAFDRDVVERVQASMHVRARTSALLTFRQTEVLQLIAEGWGNKEIASLLNISVKTVEFHRGRIMAKLGAHNAADLIRYAFQSGMLGM